MKTNELEATIASTLQMGRLAFQEPLANLRRSDLPTSKPFSANGGRITVTDWGWERSPCTGHWEMNQSASCTTV